MLLIAFLFGPEIQRSKSHISQSEILILEKKYFTSSLFWFFLYLLFYYFSTCLLFLFLSSESQLLPLELGLSKSVPVASIVLCTEGGNSKTGGH